MKAYKILLKLLGGSKNIRFEETCLLLQAFGFTLERINGSHHIFKRNSVAELINVQNVDGKVKPYQIKQILMIIEKYSLKFEEER